MIASMTGFARHTVSLDTGVFDWELKSVNHRYLESRICLPDALRSLEPEVRGRLKQAVARGKVDVILRDRGQATDSPTTFDRERVRELIHACDAVGAMMTDPARVSPLDLLGWRGVLDHGGPADPEALAEPLLAGLERALEQLVAMRNAEGRQLIDVLRERLDALAVQAAFIRERREPTLREQRERLSARISELDVSLDPKRLEQEVALLAQRQDVAEELDRTDGHIAAVREALDGDGPCGRRLDFLMQEFNREANTLASKSHDLAVTQAAVEMKVLIEQMREQVQNLE